MSSSNQDLKIHHNIPQIIFAIIRAHITLCFWGRATGKTEGPGVYFTMRNMIEMPRSLGGLVSVSYDKLLMFILPKLIKGYERYGYIENIHFWVRKFAPENLRRETPINKPSLAKNFVHWYNGAGMQLISLDRLGMSNAADLDWIYADEGRLFDYEKFVEVINANRGNAGIFGGNAAHHSILITTDKPRDSKGQWLYDLAASADTDAMELIVQISEQIFNLNQQLSTVKTKAEKNRIQAIINDFEIELNEIRLNAVALIEASTLDNIHALGVAQIKTFVRTLSKIVYDTSILNKTLTAVEEGFYPNLDEDHHGYFAVNDSYIDNHDIDHRNPVADCRWYNDLSNHPLEIAMDTNAKINNIVTGQGTKAIFKLQSSFYYEGPFNSLLKNWHDFYKYHPVKTVIYYHDHTDVKSRADSAINYSEEITAILRSFGWSVHPVYIGQQPSYKSRHMMWAKMLTESDKRYPKFRYNKSQAEYWAERAQATGTIIGKTGFEKDKRDEKKKGFNQVKAPHITDAADTLLMGAVQFKILGTTEFTDTIIS